MRRSTWERFNKTYKIMENKVYIASYVAHRYDDGLYNEFYAFADAEMAWRQFMLYYYEMVGEGEEPDVDLGELRTRLVERGESVKVVYTDHMMEDHIIGVFVEEVIQIKVKKEQED